MSVQIEVANSQRKMTSRPLSPDLSNGNSEDELELHGDAILAPTSHDVLLGRGGGTNNHSGNIKFRQLVNEHKIRYLACSKVDKPKVARDVVELWKKMTPPGRFLARKDETKKGSIKAPENVWYEVADKKAREKASQCLRERTPDVLPYIKQLREQQDAITEKGVSMVQHQLQMQQQRQEHYPAQMVGSMVGGEMVMMQQMLPQQQYSMDGMATLRRNSLPEPQQQQSLVMVTPNSTAYVQPGSMSIGLGPPLQQQRSMSLGHGIPSPNGATVYLSGNGNILQMPPGRYHVVQNGEVTPKTVVSQEFHHPQMMMQPGQTHFVIQSAPPSQQQQQQQQVLSMQQMPFQQPQLMARIGQPMPQSMQPQMMMVPSHMPNPGQIIPGPPAPQQQQQQQQQHAVTAKSLFEEEPEPYSVQSDPLFSMRIATPHRPKETTTETTSKEPRRRKKTPSTSTTTALKTERQVPDRTTTAASLMSIGTDIDAGGEITIEEYRKQLQQYLENNQGNEDDDNNNDDDDDGDDNNSDLEDDWEKEREKNMRESRGVGRNVSGMSFVSSKTAKSGQSMVTGISSGIFSTDLSADMSDDKNKGNSSSLNNSNRSLCSNLSLMSELTDLSENIDNLTLDD
ncbi:hypothetical protein FisN_19Lh153 [Fistulifera solaris]|uniref:DUF6824 domain-containing protein n=1 Tax=Fistulifera solaris TaxID=1519565 RepID=A0A1Z5J792_FISSO|nr:hypothetical protein FisN_19Lh153 [Fistulifera solaris]|eukprot:GAX09688.1 hypothetical protein FisN_19Lh153 [Fistulifera solaris]